MNQDNSSFGNTEPTSLFEDIQELSKSGATSDTYKVRLYGKWHFLKRIKKEFRLNPLYIQAFEKEFDLGYQLTHPNIVRYLSKGSDKDGFYIITEYVDGLNLLEYITKNPTISNDKQFVNRAVREILSVLDYLHNKQIIHLDIKPENILVTNIGKNIKVIDLGFSSSDSYDSIPCGTLTYSSPEQFNNPIDIDVTSDIFSFGKLLIFLFTGTTDIENISKLPFAYRKIAQKCTQAKPENRYSNINEITKSIEAFSHRRKAIIVSLLVLASLIILLSGIYYYQNNSAIVNTSTNVEKSDTVKSEQGIKQVNPENEQVKDVPKSVSIVSTKTLSLSAEVAVNKYYLLLDSLFTDFDKELPNLDKTNYMSLMNAYNLKMKTIFEWYESQKSLMDKSQKSIFENAFLDVWDKKARKNFELVNPFLLPILSNTLNKKALAEDSVAFSGLKKSHAGHARVQMDARHSGKRIYTHTDSLLIAKINKSEYYPHMKKMLISIMDEFSTEENLRNTINRKLGIAFDPLIEYITKNDKYLNSENDSGGIYFREFRKISDEFFYYATYLTGCYASYLNYCDCDLKNKDDQIYKEEIKKYKERLNTIFASRYDNFPNF